MIKPSTNEVWSSEEFLSKSNNNWKYFPRQASRNFPSANFANDESTSALRKISADARGCEQVQHGPSIAARGRMQFPRTGFGLLISCKLIEFLRNARPAAEA